LYIVAAAASNGFNTNEGDSIRIDTNIIIVTDDGEEHVDSIVSDAIASSSSLLRDNGLSQFGVCIYIYMNVICIIMDVSLFKEVVTATSLGLRPWSRTRS